MERTLHVFVIPDGRPPAGPPEPGRTFAIRAASLDGLRAAAQEKLVAEGYRIRSLSFGAKGLVAYVEASR